MMTPVSRSNFETTMTRRVLKSFNHWSPDELVSIFGSIPNNSKCVMAMVWIIKRT